MKGIEGRVAIVTGAGSGIGRAKEGLEVSESEWAEVFIAQFEHSFDPARLAVRRTTQLHAVQGKGLGGCGLAVPQIGLR